MAAAVRIRRLDTAEKAACRGVVSRADLEDLRVIFTRLPRLWGASATTLWTFVLTDPAREGAERWHELIAHEAVHVEQWRDRGVIGFGMWYLGHYFSMRMRGFGHWDAYARNPAETDAAERASAIPGPS